MPPPQKGKAPTKGAKQILTENAATITFYRNMALGSVAVYFILSVILNPDEISVWTIILNIVSIGIQVGCHRMMVYTSRPRYADGAVLLDAGLDLNMEGGMGEHMKDVVILASVAHALAALSGYFWLLLLLLPARACWLLWTNLLGPWFFQRAPENTEHDEKKRKKMERKMKRYQQ